MSLRKFVLAAIFLACAIEAPALAQGPLHKQVNFTINVPFELVETGVVLPSGNYVLYQLNENEPNLFALYRENMKREPVAILRTMRINYLTGSFPTKTKLMLDTDEASAQLYPILKGWTIPGEDGFEVVATSLKPGKESRPVTKVTQAARLKP